MGTMFYPMAVCHLTLSSAQESAQGLNTTFSERSSLTSRSEEKGSIRNLFSLIWLSEFSLGTQRSLPFLTILATDIVCWTKLA